MSIMLEQTDVGLVADIVRTHALAFNSNRAMMLSVAIEKMENNPKRIVYARDLADRIASESPELSRWVKQRLRFG